MLAGDISRYADDLTFSTNQKEFPSQLAHRTSETLQWQLGAALMGQIENSGFRVNQSKTRMQLRGSRQVTTGLLVNEKVNIRPEYYRTARAMCNALFSTGFYYRIVPANPVAGKPNNTLTKVKVESLGPLEGALAHIHCVRRFAAQRQTSSSSKASSAEVLYAKFLFYKHFVALKSPLIITEGKTDPLYLRAAIKQLTDYHSLLGYVVDGAFFTKVRFMNFTTTVHEVLHLGNGVGGIKTLISRYAREVKRFNHAPLMHPVVIVIDNDVGAKDIFKMVKSGGGYEISLTSKRAFYRLGANLYLVKTPEVEPEPVSCIEDLFDPELFKTKIGGKTYDPKKKHGAADKYSKFVFAEQVVKTKADTIDFTGFAPLLNRIVAALQDYEARKSEPESMLSD